jgi:uncharacterized protein YuzE
MGAELTIEYYGDADILTLSKCQSYRGQETEEIGDSVIARMNPDTGEIEYVEILFFKARLEQDGEVRLPIDALLRPVTESVTAD